MSALRIEIGAASLRRALGPVAWFVLEELLLRSGAGGIVETNVRALAADLSLNKDTVARSLGVLRAQGLVHAATQSLVGGRFGPAATESPASAG